MSLFWEECRKILEKRIVWIFAAALFGFLGVYIFSDLQSRYVKEDGVRYRGIEAVQKDREIAEEWEGTLTMETLFRILDTYGASVMETDAEGTFISGNWVSRFATYRMTDSMQGGNAALLEDEKLKRLEDELNRYQPYFTYMDGFDSVLLEGGMMGNVGVLLLAVIALAPVFAEEYDLGTAPLLLTSVHGRKKDIRRKILAALALTGAFYLLVNGCLFLAYLGLYGGSGLRAGACLSSNIARDLALTCGEVWRNSLVWGFLGVLMMAAITLLFSARSRNSFQTLIQSLVCLVSGLVFLKVLPAFMPNQFLYLLCFIVGKWSPVYLTMDYGLGSIPWEMPWKLIYVLGVTALCAVLGQRLYKKHEC